MTRRTRVLVAGTIAVGSLLRLAWGWYAARTPQGLHDPSFYRLLAHSIATGHGYQYFDGASAYYPPGYPTVLAAAVWLLDHTPLPGGDNAATVLVNVAAGAVLIWCTFLVGRRIADERAGLVAAAIVALWPNLVVHAGASLSESLYLAIFMATVAAALATVLPLASGTAHRVTPHRRQLVVVGLLVAAGTYVRPVSLPIIAALAIAWLVAGHGWRATARDTAIVTAVAAALLAPWTVRNAVVIGSPVFTTNTGDNVCISRQPGANGAFQLTPACGLDLPGLARPDYERERDELGRQRAAAFVRDHPTTEVRLWFERIAHGFENDSDAVRAVESYGNDPFLSSRVRRGLELVSTVFGAAVLVAALGALPRFLRGRRADRVLLVATAALVGVLPIVVFFGDPRFHVPLAPLAAVIAATWVSRVIARPHRTDAGRPAATVRSAGHPGSRRATRRDRARASSDDRPRPVGAAR